VSVITIEIPDQGSARIEFVEDLVNRIKYDARGSFADVLFDIQDRAAKSVDDRDAEVTVVTHGDDDPKIADAARVAAVTWSGALRMVAEEIYRAARR
jgi:hypothetical protein